MNIGFAHSWVLWGLPLGLLPIFLTGQKPITYSSLGLIPRDWISTLLDWIVRVVGMLAIALLIVAVSGPYRPELEVERIGQGAQLVLLLDRSRSMDQPYYTGGAPTYPLGAEKRGETKGAVARGLLAEFVASSKDDMFGMVVFSSNPLEVLPLTQKQAAIQAAIEAGNIGRGLAETDVGTGLEHALRFFQNQPYTGSRIVVLVSDGAATLNLGTQHRIQNLMQRNRVALYWIYLRTRNSVSLVEESDDSSALKLAPQQALHQFFSEAEVPYRAYMAENPQELKRAIEDVGRLQNLPIRYQDVIPRHDLSNRVYAITFVLLALLTGFKFIEVRAWR